MRSTFKFFYISIFALLLFSCGDSLDDVIPDDGIEIDNPIEDDKDSGQDPNNDNGNDDDGNNDGGNNDDGNNDGGNNDDGNPDDGNDGDDTPDNSFPGLDENDVDIAVMLDLINEIRAEGCDCGGEYMPPVGPLVWNEKLERAAFDYSYLMDSLDFFGHFGPNDDYQDSNPMSRARAAGYIGGVGENIAYGTPLNNEERVMSAWLASPGHCRNIMNANYKEVGVGVYGRENMWTQMFGQPLY